MSKAHDFNVNLIWSGGEQGPVRDYASYSREYRIEIEGKPDLACSADPVFKGDGALHNPEDLFVTTLASCHMLTYLALCARAGIEVVSYEDRASGTLVLDGGGGRFTEVTLRPRVAVAAGADMDKALALHEAAHADCFIANSVNFPVHNEPRVVEAAHA